MAKNGSKQLVFIDDSGNPGLKRGVSNLNFVLAAVLLVSPAVATALNREISNYRKSLGWKNEHEFKFRKAPKEVKLNLLKIVNQYDIKIYAVYINRSDYYDNLKVVEKEKIYNWAIVELLKTMPLKDAVVKIDGRSGKKHRRQMAAYVRQQLNRNLHKIQKFEPQDSVRDNLIQLADIVAGSINRSFQTDKTDSLAYLEIISDKLAMLKELKLKVS